MNSSSASPASRPPSVDSLAKSLVDTGLPQPLLVDAARQAIAMNQPEKARDLAEKTKAQLFQPVINASGVLLHTNLGRAPFKFSQPAAYTNLELDLESGERGSRQDHLGGLFARLGGAEAGLVVNNCSAAVTLILAALAGQGDGVAVSRGELVEIGGGFRVPEVITQSGAKLVEVGTTNRTRLQDYKKAVKKGSAALCLKVHQSNYRLKGFTEATAISELKSLGVPIVADIGSGLLDAGCPWLDGGPPIWLKDEPAAVQSLQAGADLVAFSADKLLGGPQAGIILGKAELIQSCSRHPLARAFRPGSLIIGALADLAFAYLHRAGDQIPFWQMAVKSEAELKSAAESIVQKTQQGRPVECFSVPGGGTLPEVEIASYGVALEGDWAAQLRSHKVPVISRVVEGQTILDLRTVFEDQLEELAVAIKNLRS